MIDIDNWIRELDEEEETAVKDNEEYQRSLFCEYVLRKNDNLSKRKELQSRYLSGENITGEKACEKNWLLSICRILGVLTCRITLCGNHLHFMRNWMPYGNRGL